MVVMVLWAKADYTNPDAVNNVVKYIVRDPGILRPDEVLTGGNGLFHTEDPEEVIRQMMETKEHLELTSGRQCMHFVLSFPSRPKLSQKKLRKKIEKTLGFWRDHYQYFWGTHCKITTKGTENYHVHVILNSVDFVTGNKLDISMDLRKKFQRYARRMWKDVEPK